MSIEEKMRLFWDNPVISWHEHLWNADDTYSSFADSEFKVLKYMETVGFDRIVCSLPITDDKYCPPERFIAANNLIYKATQMYPGKIYGMAFVNPGYQKEALAEAERCVKELGFVGIKLYHQYTMDNPVQFPLIEKCIELDIPILMHSAHVLDAATRKRQPRISDGFHMANAARRYPEATFLMAHIGGGGDWKWSIKAIADCPNVYADIGGSVYDSPMIEESVKLLGADRILFATDGLYSSCVGKILGADISEEDKKTILSGKAFERFISKGGVR